jgi:hypothetical protein
MDGREVPYKETKEYLVDPIRDGTTRETDDASFSGEYILLLKQQIALYPDCDPSLLIKTIRECPEESHVNTPTEFWVALLRDAESANRTRVIASISVVLHFLFRFPGSCDLIYDIFWNNSLKLMWCEDMDVSNAALEIVSHLFLLNCDDLDRNLFSELVQFHKANLLSTESRFCDKVLAVKFYRDCGQLFTEEEMRDVFDVDFMCGLTEDLLNCQAIRLENQPTNRYESLDPNGNIGGDLWGEL